MANAGERERVQEADLAPARAAVPIEDCGLAFAAAVLGDRWTLLILRQAIYGVRRFDALQADLKAPRAALSDRLSSLVAAGLLARRPYREPGRRLRHEYVLTAAGVSLLPALAALTAWGDARCGRRSPVRMVEADSGKALELAFVTRKGRRVEPGAVRLEVTGGSA